MCNIYHWALLNDSSAIVIGIIKDGKQTEDHLWPNHLETLISRE